MAVKATAAVTVSAYRDTKSITRYYKLVSATASAPTIAQDVNPSEISGLGWTDTEPTYTNGSTDILYFFDASVFSDGTWLYSKVSKLSGYEAAKDAYEKAVEAAKTATNFLSYDSTNGLLIGNKTSGAWSGYRSQMLPLAFNILDASGNIVSSYGEITTIGKTSGQHVLIDSDSFDIKNSNTLLASFQADKVELGKNSSSAIIEMVGGKFNISYKDTGIIETAYGAIKGKGSIYVIPNRLTDDGDFNGATASFKLTEDGDEGVGIIQKSSANGGRQAFITADSFRLDVNAAEFLLNDLVINGESLADYIIERGTSGIWTYEKWASGKAVCWGYFLQSVTITSGFFGSSYGKTNGISKSLPSIFNTVKTCIASGVGDGFVAYVVHAWANTSMFYATPIAGSSGTKTFGVSAEIKGTWK